MNVVGLVGRLVRDVELRYTPNGETAVGRFTLAIPRPTRDKETDFVTCVAFGKTAELASTYLSKGKQCAVSGRIQTGSYEKKDGTKVYTVEVVADRVEFLTPKNYEEKTLETEQEQMPMGFAQVEEDIPF